MVANTGCLFSCWVLNYGCCLSEEGMVGAHTVLVLLLFVLLDELRLVWQTSHFLEGGDGGRTSPEVVKLLLAKILPRRLR